MMFLKNQIRQYGSISYFKQKLEKLSQRSLKAIINILLSLLFKGGNMIINIMLVPLTIGFVNVEEYGIWLTLSSMIAWLSISDIGLGHGLRNKFAEAIAMGNNYLARSYVSTTYFALFFFVSTLWIIFILLNQFIDWGMLLNVREVSSLELSRTVLILFTSFSIQFVVQIVGTVLTANQMPGKAASFGFFSNSLILILIFVLKYSNYSGSLSLLAIITGASQFFVFVLATLWFYSYDLKEYRPSVRFFKRKYVVELMSLGVKFFLIQISMIFMFQCTNIIISQILGPEQVTVYNIAYKYFMIPMSFALIVVSPMWSAFTDAYVKKDYIWMNKIYRLLSYLIFLTVCILVSFLFFSDILYNIWLGSKIKIPYSISFLMAINISLAMIFNVYIFIVNGIGKIYLQLLLNIIIGITNVPLAIFLGINFGLEGIITAGILVNLVYAVLMPIQSWKLINQKATGIWQK